MSFRGGVDTTYKNKARVRGGAGDFSWDQLKGDRQIAESEFYLGRSQMCENLWYQAKGSSGSAPADLEGIKNQEEDLMREMLGLRPARRRQRGELSEREEREALQREGRQQEEHAPGLGLNLMGAKKASAQFIANTGQVPEGLQRKESFLVSSGDIQGDGAGAAAAGLDAGAAPAAPPPGVRSAHSKALQRELERERKRERKQQRKEKKRRKKEKKKLKKERKKLKKLRKRQRESSSDTTSSSGGSSSEGEAAAGGEAAPTAPPPKRRRHDSTSSE
eukprot:TRINITY_DN26664_c0_g5_i1.p2 TRINITY_DN26664_c0_g5~~TRINITY_DN26664_c0_g5_i1.p2  ORF type:complete len:307 (+),score=147.31 TRINITY_DN26664_c0_g5_i1:95-922(+)